MNPDRKKINDFCGKHGINPNKVLCHYYKHGKRVDHTLTVYANKLDSDYNPEQKADIKKCAEAGLPYSQCRQRVDRKGGTIDDAIKHYQDYYAKHGRKTIPKPAKRKIHPIITSRWTAEGLNL